MYVSCCLVGSPVALLLLLVAKLVRCHVVLVFKAFGEIGG